MKVDALTIKVWYSETNGGFMYDIFDTEDTDDESQSIDGGLCTSNDITDALEMASEQMKQLIKQRNQVK